MFSTVENHQSFKQHSVYNTARGTVLFSPSIHLEVDPFFICDLSMSSMVKTWWVRVMARLLSTWNQSWHCWSSNKLLGTSTVGTLEVCLELNLIFQLDFYSHSAWQEFRYPSVEVTFPLLQNCKTGIWNQNQPYTNSESSSKNRSFSLTPMPSVRSPTSLATAPFSKSLVAPMTFVHVEFQCDKFRHFDGANH